MAKETVTVEEATEYLNGLLEADPLAIRSLLINRVPCNQNLAEHPTCQVMAYQEGFMVGLMGVINGLFGTFEDGWGQISFWIEEGDGGRVVGFYRVPPEEHSDSRSKASFANA